MDLTDPYIAREIRAALVDGLKSKNQPFMDQVIVDLVVRDGCDVDILERLHLEALRECPDDVIEFWLQPCPCGICPN